MAASVPAIEVVESPPGLHSVVVRAAQKPKKKKCGCYSGEGDPYDCSSADLFMSGICLDMRLWDVRLGGCW
jgi:hypothetical protein